MVRDEVLNKHVEGDTGLFLNEDGVPVGAWYILPGTGMPFSERMTATSFNFDSDASDCLALFLHPSSIKSAYEITFEGLVPLCSNVSPEDYEDAVHSEINAAARGRFFWIKKEDEDGPLLVGLDQCGVLRTNGSTETWSLVKLSNGEEKPVQVHQMRTLPATDFVAVGKMS